MARSELFYVRFMDNFLVLSPTRWKIRKAVIRLTCQRHRSLGGLSRADQPIIAE